MKLQMCCVSSDGLSVLGHWFCVSVQTGCALQLWHHNNMHQTLQRSFLNISDLMCNKTMRVPHIRGKLWENLRRTEGCNLLQSLQILIPDLAWVSSDARCRRSFPFKYSTNSGHIKQVLLTALWWERSNCEAENWWDPITTDQARLPWKLGAFWPASQRILPGIITRMENST